MSEPTNPTLIPHIIASAEVPVKLNTSHINGLYAIHQTLLDLLTPDGITALKLKYESKQPINGRELAFMSITQVLDMVYKSATANNMTEMRPIDDALKQAIQSQTSV